jgi:hypothetical protein
MEAKAYVRSLGLKSVEDWRKYSKSDKRPPDIPATPERVYKKEWKGMGDWLGTGTVAPKDRQYRPFAEAREFVRSLGLKNREEWESYCKSGKKPVDIPTAPWIVYEDEWEGQPDWLGYEEKQWSVNKIKELLRDLIASKIIYQWNEAVLYSFLIRRGVLSLDRENRHFRFFKNLIEATRSKEGRKAIEQYATSHSVLVTYNTPLYYFIIISSIIISLLKSS